MNRKIFFPLIAVFTGLLVAVSCTKLDTTDLGKELIPEVDNINTFEMIVDVESDNIKFDDTTRLQDYINYPVFTKIPHRQPIAIGEISDDAEFGKTTGAAFFTVTPNAAGAYPFGKRDTVKIDSVVLSLAYEMQYGDTLAKEEFEVFEIDQSAAFGDTAYFIKSPDFPVKGGRIGHKLVDFQTLNDSLSYVNVKDTIRTVNELRIPLDTTFGRMIVNGDTNMYKTDSAFRTLFKGFAVKVNGGASPNPRALAYFDLTSTTTRVTFYCRVQNNGKSDTIAPAFIYSYRQHNAVRRTEQHGYQQYLTNGTPKDDKIYLASSPGSYASIKIPALDTMTNKAIHRAELILERLAANDDNYYAPPPLLYIDGMNNTADSFFTMRGDFVPQSSGLSYDVASLEGLYKSRENRYTFNLTRHVQTIIGPKRLPNYTLRVYAPYVTFNYFNAVSGAVSGTRAPLYINDPIASGRVVLGGGSHPTQKMRLRIIYSKI